MSIQNKIIDRILASYLERCLDENALEYGDSDILKHCNAAGLAQQDVDMILDAAKKKKNRLVKSALPMTIQARNWVRDIQS